MALVPALMIGLAASLPLGKHGLDFTDAGEVLDSHYRGLTLDVPSS